MARYVLVESRDPVDTRDVGYYCDLALKLAEKGEQVTLFLVQNAVLAVRKELTDNPLTRVANSGVEVLVDSFSLRERGIRDEEHLPG